jgi:hypothetical protein
MRAIAFALLVASPTSAYAQQAPSRLNLVCVGAGSANKVTNTYAYGADNNGNSAWANVTGNRTVPFDDQVNLWIEGNQGRLRMPRTMLPKLHGGEGGWFEINDLKMDENEITGSVAVNFANHPKLRIDRITGAISLSGKAGDYSGHCSAYDPATVQRAF